MTGGWVYWTLFSLAVLVTLVGIPKAIWWIEDRNQESEDEAWLLVPGAVKVRRYW